MHGRLKVKTTAQQEEEKKKERQKKLKIFQKATSLAFTKIENKAYDGEGLEITKQILSYNSDYSSMWNYRKNALQHLQDTVEPEKMTIKYKNELDFIESCLRNNPKSYGCWHQRCFVMLNMKEPDWKQELHLCDTYLQFDDRNFHCWDYRRFVTSHASISDTDEVAFTHKLIETNFSNYSSWHYRSKLLPKAFPDQNDLKRIEEKKLLEELELVQNAFFTDPNDQSAWFYHRWLLGRGDVGQSIVSLQVERASHKITCCLRLPLKNFNGLLTINDETIFCVWQPSTQDRYSHIWECTAEGAFPEERPIVVVVTSEVGEGGVARVELPVGTPGAVSSAPVGRQMFQDGVSKAKLSLLEEQLASCGELNELEPGNKWVMLTVVLLMRATDPAKHGTEVERMLRDLESVDPQRRRYYADLRSKYVIEDCVITACSLDPGALDCSGKELTRLCHFEFLTAITHLDISSNCLQRLTVQFNLLRRLKVLKADKNEICDISGIKDVPCLEKINLDSNQITTLDCLKTLESCPALQAVSLCENPVQFDQESVADLFKGLRITL